MEEGISNHTEATPGRGKDDVLVPPAGRVDIAQFVVEVEKFNRMIEPFAFVLYLWDDVRRWRYPILTVILWIVCNIGCLILTQAAMFTLMSLVVITIATACLVQLHTRLFDRFLPETTQSDPWSDEPVDEHMALQTVRDFKFSLMQMHDFVLKCNEYLKYFYSLLRWDETRPSLRFHIELCAFLLCLVVMPTRWVFFLVTNWFFLATEDVYHALQGYITRLIECAQGKRNFMSVFNNEKPTANGNVQKQLPVDSDSSPDTETITSTDSHEGDMLETPEETAILDGGGDISSQSKPGMVARLMELKRRRQRQSNECCFECKTSFSSILKRRYYCRHCGNNFCTKCCNQKVPKSLFGATAPSAQTDTVLVCGICYKLLMEENQHGDDEQEKVG